MTVFACSSRIPSATQSPEGEDGSASNFGLRLRFLVSHLQQIDIRGEHLHQTNNAAFIGGKRVLACTRERRFTARQDADLRLAFYEGGKRVLHFLRRPQNGEPVCRECFSLAATRSSDLRIDAAEVEQAPAK